MRPCHNPYCECGPDECKLQELYSALSKMQPYDPSADVQELAKWLNEEPNRPLNKQALARILTYLR